MTLRAKVVVGLGLAFVVAVASGCSGGGGTAPSPTIPPGAPNVAAGPTVSINAGGQDAGGFWADQFFSGGATYSTRATIDVSQIASPPPAAIFSTERYGAMTYAIPDRAGAQTVTLYFAEVYVTGPGQRLFTVKINGTAVLSDLGVPSRILNLAATLPGLHDFPLPWPVMDRQPELDLIGAIVPFQLLACELARQKGLIPERMRYPDLSRRLRTKTGSSE